MIYKTIEELTTVVTGGTPSTSKAEYWENGNIPWLQSGCCQNCDVNQADKFISQSGYDNSSTQVMPVNTVMIALTGATAGKVGYLNIEACGNQSITGIFPCEELNPRFLFYFLISQRRKVLVECVGGAQAHISQGYVKKIKVPVYSKSIQERIVNIMNICSKNIKHYEMILKEYDELIKARFIEMFGEPVSNDKGWVKDSVERLCREIYGGGTPSKSHPEYYEGGEIPWITSKDMKTDILIDSQIHINEDGVANSTARIVPSNSVIMVIRSGILKHTLPIAINAVPVTVNQDLKVFVAGNRIVTKFLAYQFKMMERDILSGVRAVTADNIEFDALKRRKLIVPPMELQQEFADFVEQIDKSRFDIKKSIIELEREVVYD